MKKQLLASLIAGTCAAMASAAVTTTPGDRIDAYTGPDKFQSIMVDDIKTIKYMGDPVSGYTHIVIETTSGTVNMPIDGLHQLVYSAIDGTAFEIKVVDAEHAKFRMLYNHNNPDAPDAIDPTKPYGWRGASAGTPVLYLLAPEKGYTADYTVKGVYSGTDYLNIRNFVTELSGEVTAQFGIGVDCLMYTMPFEPTVMTISATELNDYAGLPILGTYHGGRLSTLGNGIRSGNSDEFSFQFKANTTFVVNTTDEDGAIELVDCYTYNDENKSFANIPDPDDVNVHPDYLNVKWGFSGIVDDNNVLFFEAKYIPDPVTSNNRRYFAAPLNSTFTVADDGTSGSRMLLELKPQGGKTLYYFFENNGYKRTPVTAEFVQGTSIADDNAVAYLVYDGVRQVKYVRVSAQEPSMIVKGAEAGTYTYNGTGSHTTLVLDGFGTATIDGTECDYTIETGIVTIKLPSGQIQVIIDTTAKTYKEKSNDVWTGAKTFKGTNVMASYAGNTAQANATITVNLDKYPNGNDAPGSAAIIVEIPRPNDYNTHKMEMSGTYVFDSSAKTITVANVATYVWNGTEYKYGRRSLTFHLADDMQSMYLGNEEIGDYLRNAKDGSYVVTGQDCVLYAEGVEKPEPEPAVDITGTFSGKAPVSSFFGNFEATLTLTVTDATATIDVDCMGTAAIHSEVDYEFANNVLTLKNVTVGNGDMTSGQNVQSDITFNYEGGQFIGNGTYYGTTSMTASMAVTFEGVALSKN
ncbi:MAG: hypothetical protein NC338_08045 [Firmicutes bacterium]|nr:hypothetical protein [Bacillota bacterium]MCM1401936.1 hypothetical protein [Bacteroides sp.]MCM1477822.1 hypothetical protein [Bacteroides sp.]